MLCYVSQAPGHPGGKYGVPLIVCQGGAAPSHGRSIVDEPKRTGLPDIPGIIEDVEHTLACAGYTPAGLHPDYGTVVTGGYRVGPTGHDGLARVEYACIDADRGDPNRPTEGMRNTLRLDMRTVYAEALRNAGFAIEEKLSGMTGRPYLTARRPR